MSSLIHCLVLEPSQKHLYIEDETLFMDPGTALIDALGGIPESVERKEEYIDVVSDELPADKTRFYMYGAGNMHSSERKSEEKGDQFSFDIRMENQSTVHDDCDMVVVCGYLESSGSKLEEDTFLFVDNYMNGKYGKISAKPQRPYFYEETINRAIEHGIATRNKSGKKYGPDGETVLVTRKDTLSRGITLYAALPVIRGHLQSELPSDWRESSTRGQRIERVVEVFLTQTDPDAETAERREKAQQTVAEQQDIKLNKVKEKCGSELWYQSSNSYQTEYFDVALENIEKKINLSTAKPSSSSIELPWTDPEFFSNDQEEANPPEVDLYFPDQIQSEVNIERRVDSLLRGGSHLIFTGPPGSGKTELAKEVCEHYRKNNNGHHNEYQLTTATSDWSTFETIGGYRPDKDGGSLRFSPGLFLERFADKNMKPRNEWLVIDELNRANIDEAFGSLFSVLTGETVTLPFSVNSGEDNSDEHRVEIHGDPESGAPIKPHRYYVPDDWRLIATMNSVDKASLYRMSYAFMRRFAFVNVPVPTADDIDPELVSEYLDCWDIDPEAYETSGIELEEDESFGQKLRQDLAVIWVSALERGVEFGPGIIKDIAEHALTELQTTGSLGYDQAVASHLLPQFEGRTDDEIQKLFKQLKNRRINGAENPLEEIETPEDIVVSRQFGESHLGADLDDEDDE